MIGMTIKDEGRTIYEAGGDAIMDELPAFVMY